MRSVVNLCGRLRKKPQPTQQDSEVGSVAQRTLNPENKDPTTLQKKSLSASEDETGTEDGTIKREGTLPTVDEAPLKPLLHGGASISLPDVTGKTIEGKLQLSSGLHQIKILHGENNGKLVPLTTKEPIYLFANAQLGNMTRPGACLIMNQADFNTIKTMIHGGAFGGDYCRLDNGLMAVWKLPADLKEIVGWKTLSQPIKSDVGTYQVWDDTANFNITTSFQIHCARQKATKIRIDLPKEDGVARPSVHHLVLNEQTLLPAISTGNFFADFDDPQISEKPKIKTLIEELSALGINAFMCNATHHLLILYSTASDNEQMTPQDVAEILQDNKGEAIIAAFQKAGKPDFNAKQWAESFISVYGSKNSEAAS